MRRRPTCAARPTSRKKSASRRSASRTTCWSASHAARAGPGLPVARPRTPTLSPGELQRLRLATQLRSNLFGVVYVLDEPSAGLHPADGEALWWRCMLKRAGNSLFVVEHDLALMRRADWLVDVGPEAGEKGGRAVQRAAAGACAGWQARTRARYLFGEERTAHPKAPRPPAGWLRLEGITRNNLSRLAPNFRWAC
jgi:excinuclease ABC subunit A